MKTLAAAVAMAAASVVLVVPVAHAASDPSPQGTTGTNGFRCPSSDGTHVGVKVAASHRPATVSVATTAGSTAAVTVTFSAAGHGTSITLSSADPAVRLTDATWCVKSAGDPMLGSGLSATSPNTHKKGKPQGIRYVTVYTVTTQHVLWAASACYRSDTGRGDLLLTRRIKPSRAVPLS
jgi:hypothetical protein